LPRRENVCELEDVRKANVDTINPDISSRLDELKELVTETHNHYGKLDCLNLPTLVLPPFPYADHYTRHMLTVSTFTSRALCPKLVFHPSYSPPSL
jgi:hypothetical protein